MKFLLHTGLLFLLLVLVGSMTVRSQDLGSANKIFGSKRAHPAKNTPRARKATPHPTIAKKKPRLATTKTGETAGSPSSRKPERVSSALTPYTSVAKVTKLDITDKKVSAADKERAQQLIEEAESAHAKGDQMKAESLYKSARSLTPRDLRAITGLGDVYRDQQRWEEAEGAYRAALELQPDTATTNVALSYVLTQQLPLSDLSNRYAEAEKLARRATELAPRTASAFDQLGVAMEMRGEMGGQTENAYRRAIQLDAGFAPAYAHLGRLLRRRGLTEQSKDAYKKATEHATDVHSILTVAEVLQSEQHYADSIPMLRQVLQADQQSTSALLMLGHALTVTKAYKEAELLLKRAATGPSGYMANSLLASLYMRQGALELAENALLQALRTAPAYESRQLAQAFLALGQGYTKAGKSMQAQRAYAEAAKLDPESGVYSARFKS